MTGDCIICGDPTGRMTNEQVTVLELPVWCHARCERKALINSRYGAMKRSERSDEFR